MHKMPSTAGGFNDSPKLSSGQKSKLMDMVGRYNELGQALRNEQAIVQTATSLAEIAELAETYACNEAVDWFQTEVVKGDFKRAKNISGDFQKIAKETYAKMQQLNALYEDMGHILERYYEIKDPVMEVSPNTSDIKSQRPLPVASPMMNEVKPNTSNLKSQREVPHTSGPASSQLKEVTPNTSNLQSQRDLASGGPTKCACPTPTNPSVTTKVAGAGTENLQGQREEPQGGPAPAQLKEVKPNTSNLTSQRNMPSLSSLIRM